ncbi:MAG: hypothetical protein JST92_11700, partial [Deltaproteobacteria bacterium]|nr:hypothetical protein [Deltaproteobacteria bacterium]
MERLAAGNPFLAVAVVQGLVESNALVGGAEGWRVDASKLSFVQSSRQAAAVLARRLEQL